MLTTMDPHLKTAINLHAEGDIDGAMQAYRRVLIQAPDHLEALHLYGLALTRREDPGPGFRVMNWAYQAFRANALSAAGGDPALAAISFRGNHNALWVNYLRCVLKCFDFYLADDDGSPSAYKTFDRLFRVADAIFDFQLYVLKWESEHQKIKSYVERNEKPRPLDLVIARLCNKANLHAHSITLFERRFDALGAQDRMSLGVSLWRLRRCARALDVLDEFRLVEGPPDVVVSTIKCLWDLKGEDALADYLQTRIAAGRTDLITVAHLLEYLRRSGREAAARTLSAHLSLRSNVPADTLAGLALFHLGAGDIDEADALAAQAERRGGAPELIAAIRGAAALEQARWDDACAYYARYAASNRHLGYALPPSHIRICDPSSGRYIAKYAAQAQASVSKTPAQIEGWAKLRPGARLPVAIGAFDHLDEGAAPPPDAYASWRPANFPASVWAKTSGWFERENLSRPVFLSEPDWFTVQQGNGYRGHDARVRAPRRHARRDDPEELFPLTYRASPIHLLRLRQARIVQGLLFSKSGDLVGGVNEFNDLDINPTFNDVKGKSVKINTAPLEIEGPAVWLSAFHRRHIGGVLLQMLPSLKVVDDTPELRDLPLLFLNANDQIGDFLNGLGYPSHRLIGIDLEQVAAVNDLFAIHGKSCWNVPSHIRWLRQRLRERLGVGGESPGTMVYISRSMSARRIIVNEPQLAAALQSVGCICVNIELLTRREQIDLLRSADMLIAGSGAALANSIFMRDHASIIDISGEYNSESSYRVTAELLGHDYHIFVEETVVDHDHQMVDVDRFMALLSQVVARRRARRAPPDAPPT